MTFSRDEAIAALKVQLSEGMGIDGFQLVDVRREGSDVLVLFRWRRNRQVFGMVLPWSSGVFGLSSGEPVRSVEDWVSEAGLYLTEELDTGYVRRALRRQKMGYVQLSDQVRDFDSRYYVCRCLVTVPGWPAGAGRSTSLDGYATVGS